MIDITLDQYAAFRRITYLARLEIKERVALLCPHIIHVEFCAADFCVEVIL